MKKYLTFLSLLISCKGIALPVGNPSEASTFYQGLIFKNCYTDNCCEPCLTWIDTFSYRFGFYGDYVFDRQMKVVGASDEIDKIKVLTNAFYAAFNIWDLVDFFGTLGATSINLHTDASIFEGTSTLKLETITDFSWSVGTRATLYQCRSLALGFEAQYFRTAPAIREVTLEGSTTVFNSDEHPKYHEWQLGMGVSYNTRRFIPYAAIKWCQSRWNFINFVIDPIPDPVPNLHSKRRWGYALGFMVIACDMAGITLEGRFGDEKALYVNGQVRF